MMRRKEIDQNNGKYWLLIRVGYNLIKASLRVPHKKYIPAMYGKHKHFSNEDIIREPIMATAAKKGQNKFHRYSLILIR